MKTHFEKAMTASIEQKRALLAELLRSKAEAQSGVPLSYGQKALYFLHRSAPESPAYHVAFSVRLRSQVDAGALRRALQVLIDRHEQLRATFVLQDGEPVQRIAPSHPVALEQVQAESWSEEELDQAVREAYRRPFDLERGPLFRAHLFSRGGRDHVFLITIHHIVYDAWSLWINQDELGRLYRAAIDGTPAALPPVPRSYADFTRRQTDMLQGPEGKRLAAFWQNQLEGRLTPIRLPADRPRPPVQTYAGKTLVFRIGDELTYRLRQLARQESVTPFMLILAAFQVLLHRYSGDDTILVGSPSAGRSQPAYAQTVGYFVNTLVLKAELSGNPSFRDLLLRVQETVLEALEHQDYPFPLLIERLQPVRDPSYSPIVQVSFVYQKSMAQDGRADMFGAFEPGKRLQWAGLDIEYYPLAQQEGQFDLELEIVESGSGFHAAIKYNTDLFEDSTVERMQHHFETLLEGIVARPDDRIGHLPLLTEAEIRPLVYGNSDRISRPRCGETLVTLFEARARAKPNEIAVTDLTHRLSYGELNTRANRLAHYLRRLGVGPEVLVGLYLDRSTDLIVAILGILKAGGAYLPLDPAYPKERLAFMLSDSRAPVLVTQRSRVSDLPETPVKQVCIDGDLKWIEQEGGENPNSGVEPGNLAYVIYTSGSTGKPKGAQIVHANVTRLFAETRPWYRFDEHDVWTMFHSFAFDFSVWEIWGALLYGGRLVVVPFEISRDPAAFYRLLADEKVTVLNQTPSAFSQLIRVEDDSDSRRPLQLRWVIFGGEKLDPRNLKSWFMRHGDQAPRLVNMYGITETTVHVTYRPLSISDLDKDASVIGRPIPDLKLYILDRYLQPAPIGVAGELYVAGAGLARGYLNRPELTRERFIRNPLSENPDDRLYKTGDLARRLPDGDIEYLGRIDSQVKIRGFRIELGEIEAVLLQHDNVAEAAVLVREDTPGDKRLLAYVVVHQPSPTAASDLRAYLKGLIPEYAVPAAIVVLDTLPLNHNGKVDRGALPLPDDWRGRPDRQLAIPRDRYEQRLVLLWEDILKLSPVGIQDNFFELGGHSLLAMGLMARIERAFEVKLPLSTLFQAPTPEQFAVHLRKQNSTPPWSPLVPIQNKGNLPRFFCVAGGIGTVLYYYPLAHRLGSEQPFFGLQSRGINGDCEPYESVEDMARHYLESIRAVQPEGPYWLGGHCFGGIVAFEMAQQLARAGESVALLAILDIPAPFLKDLSADFDRDDAAWTFKLGQVLEQASGKNFGLSRDDLARLDPDRQAEYLKQKLAAAEILPPGADAAHVRGLVKVFRANSAARYRPQQPVHEVPIALFRASEFHSDFDFTAIGEGDTETPDLSLGWSRYSRGPVEVTFVPGNHLTMMWDPHVQSLAEGLAATLAGIRQRTPVTDAH